MTCFNHIFFNKCTAERQQELPNTFTSTTENYFIFFFLGIEIAKRERIVLHISVLRSIHASPFRSGFIERSSVSLILTRDIRNKRIIRVRITEQRAH